MKESIISAFILTCMATSCLSRKLLHTNMIFRHGDRSPIEIYPKDSHTAAAWPDGLGMLTKIGKEQHTRLGMFLRQRYTNFIKHKLDTKEIYVQSSDIDRTLISIYSNLAGLYSTDNSVKWENNSISWQPVPVHTIPQDQDQFLAMERRCVKKETIFNETIQPRLDKVEKGLSDMASMLSGLTGYKDIAGKMGTIKDTLLCEHANGMDWPPWANWTNITCDSDSVIPCKDKKVYDILADYQLFVYNVRAETTAIHKFYGGPLVVQVVDNFNKFIKDSENTQQFFMYSAHDTTVAAVLSALGAFNNQVPQYTATVFIELYTSETADEYEVEVWYKNVTDNEKVYRLSLPDCTAPCTLKKFNKAFEPLRITNWDVACHNDFKKLTEEEIITISVCLMVVVVMLLATVICCARRQRGPTRGPTRTSHKYMKLQT